MLRTYLKHSGLDLSEPIYKERGSLSNIIPPIETIEGGGVLKPISFPRGKRNSSDHTPIGNARSNSMQSKPNSKYISVLLNNEKVPKSPIIGYGSEDGSAKKNSHKSKVLDYGTPIKRPEVDHRLSSSFMLDDNSFKKSKKKNIQIFSSPSKY